MTTEVEPAPKRHVSVMRRGLAAVVLVAIVALAIKIALGLIMTVFWIVVAVAAVVAVLWALKTLVW